MRPHLPGAVPLRIVVFVIGIGALLAGAPAAVAQQGWTGPVDHLERSSGGEPQVATDAAGNAIAVWDGWNGQPLVAAARYSRATRRWSAPVEIGVGWEPRVAMSPAGDATIAWVRYWATGSSAVMARRTSASGPWSQAVALSTEGVYADGARVGLDADGNSVVTWLESSSGSNIRDLKARRHVAATMTWSATGTVSAPGQWASNPELSVGVAGDAVATWVQLSLGSPAVVQAARLDATTGAWGVPWTLSGPLQGEGLPQVAVDPAGNTAVVWGETSVSGDGLVRGVRYDAATGAWGNGTTLSPPGQYARQPHVATGPEGSVVAVWVGSGDGYAPGIVFAATYAADAGGWAPAAPLGTVGPPLHFVSGPRAAVDAAGSIFVAWSREDYALGDTIRATRRANGAPSFEEPVVISPTCPYCGRSAPQVAADGLGNAVVVWGTSTDADTGGVQSARWEATPAAPTLLAASPGAGTLTVAFAVAASTEPAFEPTNLEYSVDGGHTWMPRTPASLASPLEIGGLSSGTTYAVTLRAVNVAGPGAAGLSLLATPGPRPGHPIDLAVTANVSGLVTLEWSPPPNSVGVSGYLLEGGDVPGGTLVSVAVPPLSTSFTFLAPAGQFYLRARSVAGDLISDVSNEVRLSVGRAGPPSAPSNLLALVHGGAVTLSWKNTYAGGALTGLWLDASGALTGRVPIPVGETVTFAAVPPGRYTVTLLAGTSLGLSAPSNPVTFYVPGGCGGVPEVPTNFRAVLTSRTIAVAWSPPVSGPAVTGYALAVTGAYTGSFTTQGRSLAGRVGPGSYTLTLAATNPCGTGMATPSVTVVVP